MFEFSHPERKSKKLEYVFNRALYLYDLLCNLKFDLSNIRVFYEDLQLTQSGFPASESGK